MFVVSLEGVLQNGTGAPIPEGVSLYRALCVSGRVVVCSEVSKGRAEHWLLQQSLTDHDEVIGSEAALPGMRLRYRQVELLRTKAKIDFVVESDPDSALEILDMGVAVMLMAHSRFTLPENRLDRARTRTWADITAEMDARMGVNPGVASGFENQ